MGVLLVPIDGRPTPFPRSPSPRHAGRARKTERKYSHTKEMQRIGFGRHVARI
jgi:hypothetical protein